MSNINTKNISCGGEQHYHPNHPLSDPTTGCMNNSEMYENRTKENFCPLCIAPLIAAVGVGTTGAGALTKDEKDKKMRDALIWTGVSILATLAIWLIIMFWKKGCKECKLK